MSGWYYWLPEQTKNNGTEMMFSELWTLSRAAEEAVEDIWNQSTRMERAQMEDS